jgi:hypothetical protein
LESYNPSVRFSDAANVADLARMLDEELPRFARHVASNAPQPFSRLAISESSMTEGTVVRSNGDGSVKLADAGLATQIHATDIVIKVIDANHVIVSPMAAVHLDLGQLPTTSGLNELWLSRWGKLTLTQPTTSGYLMQKVGIRLGYDQSLRKHYCLFMPGPVMGLVL